MAITIKVLLICALVGMVTSSGIPMWEYLPKHEKMAYLYNTFVNQVEEFCNFSSKEDCNKELLKHGLKNLHGMPEDHLDSMDPFQRGANTLIWEAMMDGHEMMKKKKQENPSSKPQPTQNSENDPYTDSNFVGSSSSRHETVLNFIRPVNKDFTTNPTKQIANSVSSLNYGPMVVRVHPDGRPVNEDKIIPVDDDVQHYMMMKTKVPNVNHFEPRNKPAFINPYNVYIRPNKRYDYTFQSYFKRPANKEVIQK